MRKTILNLLVVLLLITTLMGCAQNTGQVVEPEGTVSKDVLDENTDALGEEVEKPVEVIENLKIVTTVPSVTEVLFVLGCGDNIVGVDAYSNYPAETANIEKVGDFNGFDIEKVISLAPDIVFAGNLLQQEQTSALKDAGINVISVEPTYYDDIKSSITLVGTQVGKEKEAKALIESIEKVEKVVIENASSLEEKPSVYYVMGIGEYGNWTSGEGTFINTVMELAGGECTTANSPVEWMDYPVEDLILNDPDILIVSQNVVKDDMLSNPAYSQLSAVKNENYYFINPDIIERPGPRITEALETIQGFLLGE